jgi:hypothetical protein
MLDSGDDRQQIWTMAKTKNSKKWQPEQGALYLCDAGHCLCAAHLGATARATGRDISGQAVHRVTEDDQHYMRHVYARSLSCEVCPPPAPMHGDNVSSTWSDS